MDEALTLLLYVVATFSVLSLPDVATTAWRRRDSQRAASSAGRETSSGVPQRVEAPLRWRMSSGERVAAARARANRRASTAERPGGRKILTA